jgi:hypothetical protein
MNVNLQELHSKLNKYRTAPSCTNFTNDSPQDNSDDSVVLGKKKKITIKKSYTDSNKTEDAKANNIHNKLGLEVQLMQKRLQQYTDKKNYKKILDNTQKTVEEKESIDILRAKDIFNVVGDNSEYLTWRKLEKDEQKEILTLFFTTLDPEPEQDVIDDVFDLIDIKKLYVKREIEYDKINKQILSLPILVYDDVLKKYSCIKTVVKKKYNAKKSARQFMKQ